MHETKVFSYLKRKKLLPANPVRTAFKNDLPQIVRTIGLVCMGSTFYYLCFIYMPSFLMQNLHFTSAKASMLMVFFIAAMIFFVPVAGMLCDRIGRRKLLLFNAAFVALISIPGFYLLLGSQYVIVVLVLTIFTIASSLEQGTTSVAVVENFPPTARYTGVSIGYNFGNAIFGGSAPLICEWLTHKTHFLLAPAFYIVICALITGAVVFFFVPETRDRSLI